MLRAAGGWRAGKLRARDASGRTAKKVESGGADELRELMATKRAKVARLAAMRERVGAEMAEAMDTGVRVNVGCCAGTSAWGGGARAASA